MQEDQNRCNETLLQDSKSTSDLRTERLASPRYLKYLSKTACLSVVNLVSTAVIPPPLKWVTLMTVWTNPLSKLRQLLRNVALLLLQAVALF